MSRSDRRERIMFIVSAGELFTETPLVEDVFVSLTRLATETRLTTQHTGVFVDMELILRFNHELRAERFVVHTSDLWRTGWPTELGPVLAHLLDTSNVALVVEWTRTGRLPSLILCSQRRKTPEWRAVSARLRHLVPGIVRSTLDEPYAPPVHGRSECTCPITLDRIDNPVSISDGHTYERDAIMRYFASAGFVSPLTRQCVAPYVFENRAVVTT